MAKANGQVWPFKIKQSVNSRKWSRTTNWAPMGPNTGVLFVCGVLVSAGRDLRTAGEIGNTPASSFVSSCRVRQEPGSENPEVS